MGRGCASLLDPGCPIPRAHQRLEDAHRLWHQAAAAYNDPAAFPKGLNDTLRALRGGTWALQQESRGARNFDLWRDSWHGRIRGDEVLHWLVQTHRHTLSDEDLASVSSATVTLMSGDGQQQRKPLAEFSVPPFTAPEAITRQLAASRMGAVVRRAGSMVVERQWRAGDLQQWELMDALAHCYGALAEPLREAHQHSPEQPVQSSTPEAAASAQEGFWGQPECMTLSPDNRVAVYRLEEGRVVGQEQSVLEAEEARPRRAGDAAGSLAVEEPHAAGEVVDPLRGTALYFEEARRTLLASGVYQQRVSLFIRGQQWLPVVLTAADVQDRYQLWSRVAREVERTGAEAVLTIFEQGARRAGEGPRLVLAAETLSGRHKTFSATVERRGGQIHFGRTRFDEDGRRWYFLDPIREVWNRST